MGKEKASALCEKRVTRDSRPPPVEHARARGTGNPVLSSPPSSLLSLPPSPPPSLRSPPHLQENSDRRIERVGGGNFIESQPVKSAQGCMEPAGPWGDIADIHKKSSQAGPGLRPGGCCRRCPRGHRNLGQGCSCHTSACASSLRQCFGATRSGNTCRYQLRLRYTYNTTLQIACCCELLPGETLYHEE